MQIKIAQWNIGGGFVRRDGSDPLSSTSYTEDGLEQIIEILREENPDVVTLQKTQERGDYCQAKMIADSSFWRGVKVKR
ncbi:MAG: endonuclease/exonuclease/phosphatase family protein [Pyrinomonadaceae bacterium]